MNRDLPLILKAQKNEITEHHIYKRLSHRVKDAKNKSVLEHLSQDELEHYKHWKSLSKQDVGPSKLKIFKYLFLSSIFGLSFGLKLMERGEKFASTAYSKFKNQNKRIAKIISDEHKHEKKVLDMISEDRINYAGSIVLGLSDAMVELTGALVGLTFALQNRLLIAATGLIVGIAAALSMGASEYLASKEYSQSRPLKSATYTGITYLITVLILISPYLFMNTIAGASITMLILVTLIILGYTFYISTVKELSFKKRFFEMFLITITVSAISFFVGILVRNISGIEV